jgi:oligopeptide/dipeptide ABC transporter ATP-binding protein
MIAPSIVEMPPDSQHAEPLLVASGLAKHFNVRTGILARRPLRAVDGVDLAVVRGETFGIVGESGSGKSTLARLLVGIVRPTAGTVRFGEFASVFDLPQRQLRAVRREIQMVFQDPHASLNPRMSAGEIVERPLLVHGVVNGQERRTRVSQLFRSVGLPAASRSRYPHEFSGGQRQRIAIARALATRPQLIVLDEPTSALDVSVQATILNLLSDLQVEHGLTYILISHDMRVIEHMCTRVAVMYLGRFVETAANAGMFEHPRHPYTRALLAAVPTFDPPSADEQITAGEPPSPLWPPTGCSFHPRCPWAQDRCVEQSPPLRPFTGDPGTGVACHFAEAISDVGRPG